MSKQIHVCAILSLCCFWDELEEADDDNNDDNDSMVTQISCFTSR